MRQIHLQSKTSPYNFLIFQHNRASRLKRKFHGSEISALVGEILDLLLIKLISFVRRSVSIEFSVEGEDELRASGVSRNANFVSDDCRRSVWSSPTNYRGVVVLTFIVLRSFLSLCPPVCPLPSVAFCRSFVFLPPSPSTLCGTRFFFPAHSSLFPPFVRALSTAPTFLVIRVIARMYSRSLARVGGTHCRGGILSPPVFRPFNAVAFCREKVENSREISASHARTIAPIAVSRILRTCANFR